MLLSPAAWYPGDCEQDLSTRKLKPRNRWMAGEGKANQEDRHPGGREHLSWIESDNSAQHSPFVSPPAAGGPGESSLAGEWVARCSSINAFTSFQALGWLQHTNVPTNQGFLSDGCANEKLD